MNMQSAVLDRYTQGASKTQPDLCCPVDYDAKWLAALPREIIDKDYGCGDPSRYVRPGDVVLDLGSGAGKICYIAAQLTGPTGRVIGIDMNDGMLALARKYQPQMAATLGGDRVEFRKGHIQDLGLDIAALDQYLSEHPVSSAADMEELSRWQDEQRRSKPLVADNSVDLVISNCVLNLVSDEHRHAMVREIHRVLKPGGRFAISDIVSDEPVPESLKQDPELWSGCISGAFQEQEFPRAFGDAGFAAIRIDQWSVEPWRVVQGIEFRSVTLVGVKTAGSDCMDAGHAVIYRGPHASVSDDEGHVFPRGERMAVCERTFKFLTAGQSREDFIGIAPAEPAPGRPWCMPPGTHRPAAETKRAAHTTPNASSCC